MKDNFEWLAVFDHIKEAAKISWGCQSMDLSMLLNTNDMLYMTHDVPRNKLIFTYRKNDPFLRMSTIVADDVSDSIYKVAESIGHVTSTRLQCDYPYIITTTRERYVATSYTMFTVDEYTKVPGNTDKTPDFWKIEDNIIKAVSQLINK